MHEGVSDSWLSPNSSSAYRGGKGPTIKVTVLALIQRVLWGHGAQRLWLSAPPAQRFIVLLNCNTSFRSLTSCVLARLLSAHSDSGEGGAGGNRVREHQLPESHTA